MRSYHPILLSCVIIAITCSASAQQAQSSRGSATRRVLLEVFTGTWCPPCVMSAHRVEKLRGELGEGVIPVIIHTDILRDSMATRQTDSLRALFIPSDSTPSEIFDRTIDSVQARLLARAKAEVTIDHHYASDTRSLSATVSVLFVDTAAAGDIRTTLYVVEDSVRGAGPGYDQASDQNRKPGSPFYDLGDTIEGYLHRHVLRAIPSGAQGTPEVMPAGPMPGTTFAHTYHYTLPPAYNERRLRLVAFVSYNVTGWKDRHAVVLSATETPLLAPPNSSLHTTPTRSEASIAPMPLADHGTITLHLAAPGDLSIELHTMMGRGAATVEHGVMEQGEHSVPVDVRDLPNGAYVLIVKIDGRSIARTKVIVAH